MRRFLALLGKEVKELITPQILLPFVITIIMFMAIGQVVGAQGEEAAANRRLAVLDQDKSVASAALITAVKDAGFNIDLVAQPDAEIAAHELDAGGGTLLVVVPAGYSDSLSKGVPAPIEVYTVIRTFSVMAGQDSGYLTTAITGLEKTIGGEVLKAQAPNVDPAFVAKPLAVRDHVIIGSKQADVSPDVVMGFIMSQTTFVPIVLFIVTLFAAQMVAVAIATEKENKTLETLLAMPVARWAIVTSKMLAAALVALVSAGGYMIGMNYYMRGLTQGLGGAEGGAAMDASKVFAERLGLTLGVGDYGLLGLSLFASVLVALAFALILGAFAENVKSVQSLLTPLMVLLMVPYFLSLFTDINSLGTVAKWTIMAIPFSSSFQAAPNLFLGNTQAVLIGVGYQLVWFVVLVGIAGRIFSSDKLLTMRLSFGKRRKAARD